MTCARIRNWIGVRSERQHPVLDQLLAAQQREGGREDRRADEQPAHHRRGLGGQERPTPCTVESQRRCRGGRQPHERAHAPDRPARRASATSRAIAEPMISTAASQRRPKREIARPLARSATSAIARRGRAAERADRAASVGVARPNTIEPSTARIRTASGKNDASSILKTSSRARSDGRARRARDADASATQPVGAAGATARRARRRRGACGRGTAAARRCGGSLGGRPGGSVSRRLLRPPRSAARGSLLPARMSRRTPARCIDSRRGAVAAQVATSAARAAPAAARQQRAASAGMSARRHAERRRAARTPATRLRRSRQRAARSAAAPRAAPLCRQRRRQRRACSLATMIT